MGISSIVAKRAALLTQSRRVCCTEKARLFHGSHRLDDWIKSETEATQLLSLGARIPQVRPRPGAGIAMNEQAYQICLRLRERAKLFNGCKPEDYIFPLVNTAVSIPLGIR
jgi:hypothetical protein